MIRANRDKTSDQEQLPAAIAWLVRLMEHRAAGKQHAAATDAQDKAFEMPGNLQLLGKKLGLTRYEQFVLLLCAATEFHPTVAYLCAKIQDEPTALYPTFSLAADLFAQQMPDGPEWDAILPTRPLRHFRLIEMIATGHRPLMASALRIDEQVAAYIHGDNPGDAAPRLDPAVAMVIKPFVAGADHELADSQKKNLDEVLALWKEKVGNSLIIQLAGPDLGAKLSLASKAATQREKALFRMQADTLPAHSGEIDTIARLWRRESLLHDLCLIVDMQTAAAEPNAEVSLSRFLQEAAENSDIFLAVRDPWQSLKLPSRCLDIAKPTAKEQRAEWNKSLGENSGKTPALLAGQFNLDLSSIRSISKRVTQTTPKSESSKTQAKVRARKQLWNESLKVARPRLDALAERVDSKFTWRDIVLPKEVLGPLRQLAWHVRARSMVLQDWEFSDRMTRGSGLAALFAGASGTGKTMAAEVLANSLRLGLYRIDLSAVVSKYIGETEKNIRRVFDAAEQGGAILFFDEADALFGKRSEVRDSHDRYANIEVNYLLQRIEAYSGLAILATNMKNALDPAFTRRLRFIINFPFPNTASRARIWERSFPRKMPPRDLDYARLSKLDLTGGHIHNVALNATFRAARRGPAASVNMKDVMAAARDEYVKLEKPLNEADFRPEPTTNSQAGKRPRERGAA